MATLKQRIKELDYVELLDSVDGWDVGTCGAVVAEADQWKQVEIADDQGQMLALLSVHESRLRLIAKYSDQAN
jgi:hypothetical protein